MGLSAKKIIRCCAMLACSFALVFTSCDWNGAGGNNGTGGTSGSGESSGTGGDSGNQGGDNGTGGESVSGKANAASGSTSVSITDEDILYEEQNDTSVYMKVSSADISLDSENLTVKLSFDDTPVMWGDYRCANLVDDTAITSSYTISDNAWVNAASYMTVTGNPDFFAFETPKNGVSAGFTSSSMTASHNWTAGATTSDPYTASSKTLVYTIPLTSITNETDSASWGDTFNVVAFVSNYWWDSDNSANITTVVSAVPSAAVSISTTTNSNDTAAIDMTEGVSVTGTKTFTSSVSGVNKSVTVSPVNAELASDFMRGFDASAVNDSDENDSDVGKYYEDDGVETDVFQILKNHGANWVRIRLWNNPDSSKNPKLPGNSDLETVLDEAKRAKAAGLKILLDFHYSDYWTDPGKQLIPEEWLDYTSSDDMASAVYNYTKDVLNQLKEQNTLPDMVQVGNEINSGILVDSALDSSENRTYASSSISGRSWNDSGSSSTAYTDNFTKYLENGIKAVREVDSDAKVMLHIAGGGADIEWLLEIFKSASLDYDVIGLSYYPKESTHGTLSDLESNIKSFKSTYGKEVVVVESSFYNTYGSSVATQIANATSNLKYNGTVYSSILTDSGSVTCSLQNQVNVMCAIMEVAANSGAEGLFYWGGEYKGDWQGLFQSNGRPYPSINYLQVTGK